MQPSPFFFGNDVLEKLPGPHVTLGLESKAVKGMYNSKILLCQVHGSF